MSFHPKTYQEALERKKRETPNKVPFGRLRRLQAISRVASSNGGKDIPEGLNGSRIKPRKQRKGLRAKPDSRMTRVNRLVRIRDMHQCQWPGCEYRSDRISVHHIQERSQRPDLKYEVSNCVCMCLSHHDYLHHTVEGRQQARRWGLLGGETYEAAQKCLTKTQ